MSAVELVSAGLIGVGAFFFVAGTAGLLRFPDVYTRLHALTKADGAGLGCIVAGLCLEASSGREVLLLLGIWGLVLLCGATACCLVARRALDSGVEPWRPRA